MPHVPRATAPTGGTPPWAYDEKKSEHDSKDDKKDDKKSDKKEDRSRIGLGTLSPHDFTPDQRSIIAVLFGKEAAYDERTGELVHASTAGASAVTAVRDSTRPS